MINPALEERVHAVEQVAGSLFDGFDLIRAHRKLCALCMPAARLARALFLFYLCLPNLTMVALGLAEDPAQINQARAKVESYVERLKI